MRRHWPFAAAVLGAGLFSGCGGDAPSGALTSGALDAGAGSDANRFFEAPDSGDGGGSLQASIEAGCQAGCRSLNASASGGNPPYQYQWSDGSVAASRVVCAVPEGLVSVIVTDTAKSGELGTPAQVATATWLAEGASLSCTPEDASFDAAFDALPDAGNEADAPGGCSAGVRVVSDTGFCGSSACTPSFCQPGPSVFHNTSFTEWTSPVPLRAGHRYTLSFVSQGAALFGSAQVVAWASGGSCTIGEKLSAQSQIAETNGTWQFEPCVTPTADSPDVTLEFDWGSTSGATGDVGLQVCEGCAPSGPQ
jgi:hypothetical protein